MKSAAGMYDVIRIDHFIGMAKYYAIPADGVPAEGEYRLGPGRKLTDAIDEAIGDAQIIAEDLGVAMPEAKKLLSETGYPGMKVLEFAFDGSCTNEYLPHNYDKNCVVYTGTHDNETLSGYLRTLGGKGYNYIKTYTGSRDREELALNIIKLAYGSVADTAVLQMQDILFKDNSARMNLPSTIGQNWRWRLKKGEFAQMEAEKLFDMANLYNRLPKETYKELKAKENRKHTKGIRGQKNKSRMLYK